MRLFLFDQPSLGRLLSRDRGGRLNKTVTNMPHFFVQFRIVTPAGCLLWAIREEREDVGNLPQMSSGFTR